MPFKPSEQDSFKLSLMKEVKRFGKMGSLTLWYTNTHVVIDDVRLETSRLALLPS